MPRYLDSALVLLAVVLLISVEIYPAGRSDLEEQADFERKTETLRFELNAAEGMREARLRVRARVEYGAVGWVLTDPEGREELRGGGTDGNVRTDTGTIEEPTPGVWILEMRLAEATGDYRINWHAR